MSSNATEMQPEMQPETIPDATGDSPGGGTTDNGSEKKPKKELKPVKIPMPEDFDFRQAKGFKPEPFPDGTNMAAKWAQIRAVAAEFCADKIKELVGNHASSEMWPKRGLEVIFRDKEELRAKADRLAADADAKATAVREAKAQRAQEKTKQLEMLKAALSVAMTDELMGEKNADKPIPEKIKLGLQASVNAFKDWAPKINSWPQTSIDKAIGVGNECGLGDSVMRDLLEAFPAEEVEAKASDGKRKSTNPESTLVTPKKAKGAGSSSNAEKQPPNQKEKYRIAKSAAVTTFSASE